MRHLFPSIFLVAALGCSGRETPAPPSAATREVPEGQTSPSTPPATTQPSRGSELPANTAATPTVSGPGFELRLSAPTTIQNGVLSKLELSLTPTAGYHVNMDYPTEVSVTSSAGVSFPKNALQRSDAASFTENGARFEVPFTPSAPGPQTVQAKVNFAVCTPETCMPDERIVSIAVTVGGA